MGRFNREDSAIAQSSSFSFPAHCSTHLTIRTVLCSDYRLAWQTSTRNGMFPCSRHSFREMRFDHDQTTRPSTSLSMNSSTEHCSIRFSMFSMLGSKEESLRAKCCSSRILCSSILLEKYLLKLPVRYLLSKFMRGKRLTRFDRSGTC